MEGIHLSEQPPGVIPLKDEKTRGRAPHTARPLPPDYRTPADATGNKKTPHRGLEDKSTLTGLAVRSGGVAGVVKGNSGVCVSKRTGRRDWTSATARSLGCHFAGPLERGEKTPWGGGTPYGPTA